MQILIVEDESKLACALQQGLEEEGYSAAVALSGEEALQWFERNTPDLVLLDVMLSKRKRPECSARIPSRWLPDAGPPTHCS
jgi:DNA-binding response OmpR family regulator